MVKKSAQRQKGYSISRYKERFEFVEAGHLDRFRVGPPKFVRMPIGIGDENEWINFAKQKAQLKAKKNYDTYWNIFWELVDTAAYHNFGFRGYILNGMLQPANVSEIAGLIGRDSKSLKTALKELLDVGLIRYGIIPPLKAVGRRRKKKDDRDEKPARAGKSPAKGGGKPAENRKPLIITDNGGSSNQPKSETNNGNPSNKENPNPKTEGQSPQGQNPSPNSESANPTQIRSSPGEPQETSGPPGSSVNAKSDTCDIYSRYHSAKATTVFADAIYAALGCPWDKNGLRGQMEYQSFVEAWYWLMCSGKSVDDLTVLWDKLVKKARELGRKRDTKKWKIGPEAAFQDNFNKMTGRQPKNKKRSESG
jgi:hypothetical protein